MRDNPKTLNHSCVYIYKNHKLFWNNKFDFKTKLTSTAFQMTSAWLLRTTELPRTYLLVSWLLILWIHTALVTIATAPMMAWKTPTIFIARYPTLSLPRLWAGEQGNIGGEYPIRRHPSQCRARLVNTRIDVTMLQTTSLRHRSQITGWVFSRIS